MLRIISREISPARKPFLLFVAVAVAALFTGAVHAQDSGDPPLAEHVVLPGDTWAALALRYGVSQETLRQTNWHPNPARNPVIGDKLTLPPVIEEERMGRLYRGYDGGLLGLALTYNLDMWELAAAIGLKHPNRPLHGQALFLPSGDSPPRDLPAGFQSLELSAVPAQPGWPLAFRAMGDPAGDITAHLGTAQFDSFVNTPHLVGVGGTGAFFEPGAPELTVIVGDTHLWAQPWRVITGTWEFDQITLTGEAAAIDQEAIAAERERMFQIWTQVTPQPLWRASFRRPIEDFLQISSTYGARRSYNGGPYSSYHEGVDFSAYAGTPVFASGDGVVVLAEQLYVRGGAVVIDHGLGIYSGYYHMSEVHAVPGQTISAGDIVGEVGSEGLSSGNHLHWDLLVAATWVDASAWHERDLACWILEGWGTPCAAAAP